MASGAYADSPLPLDQLWPDLPLNAWKDTYDTLHMWTQIVGKIRMALTPPANHWWHVPLYACARGLTTSAMPYEGRMLEMRFDFVEHALEIESSDGTLISIPLQSQPVADLYRSVMEALRGLGVEVKIWTMPVEVANPIPFERDFVHTSYDREYAERFWRIIATIEPVFQEFRGEFVGKSSPVHFFWGSFDLAVTRFSGRRAPEREGIDPITREAYSHEVISCGWWPGGTSASGAFFGEPVFYSYAAPEPPGFSSARVRPAPAFYNKEMSEFLLRYDDVRRAVDPRDALLEFARSTYEAGATLGNWDREALEGRDTGKRAA